MKDHSPFRTIILWAIVFEYLKHLVLIRKRPVLIQYKK